MAWQRRPSKAHKGHSYWVHEACHLTQWLTPPASATPVARHYDDVARAPSGGTAPAADACARHVRSFNNWVKASVIDDCAGQLAAAGLTGLRVLEMAGGKGGDLHKWKALTRPPVTQYTHVDVSVQCVAEARRRCAAILKCPAAFAVQDLCDAGVASEALAAKPVHLVNLQFAVNYMAADDATLLRVMRRAAAAMAAPAFLIITFLNWTTLEARLRAAPDGELAGGLATPVLSVRLLKAGEGEGKAEEGSAPPDSAPAYEFSLSDCVRGCPEYGVTFDDLEAAAVQAGLTTHLFLHDLTCMPDNRLSARMGVDGARADDDAMFASSLYSVAVFARPAAPVTRAKTGARGPAAASSAARSGGA